MKRITAHLVVVMLVMLAGAVASPASSAPSGAGVCAGNQALETFDVVAEPRRNAYRVGQSAVVVVTVTDRFTGAPQSDIDAGVWMEGKRDKAIFSVDKTDEDGRAVLRLPLKRSWVEPGWARATVGAWEWIMTPYYCAARYGYREYPRLFRIRP